MDVSEGTLRAAAADLSEAYPGVQVEAVVADFTLHLGHLPRGGRRMVAFLGGTIGNLYVEERGAFLGALADTLVPGDSLLLGTDLVKSSERLIDAYNDPAGVTAEFVTNSLRVVNRELGADFALDAFAYVPFWDPHMERMDLRLRAEMPQRVRIPGADLEIDLAFGEEIRVEISTKFRPEGIREELSAAGFTVSRDLDRRCRRLRPDAGPPVRRVTAGRCGGPVALPRTQGGRRPLRLPRRDADPDGVAEAVHATLVAAIANRGSVTAAEQRADAVVVAARRAIGDLLATDPGGVIFGRSMTALTFELSRALSKEWSAGDEVVVSRLDHDANVRPWVIAAESVGATVRWIDFDPATGELTPEDVRAQLSERTRLVALTGASNLIGTRPDLATIADAVHAVGALFYVDGVHLTAHASIDVAQIGADLFACSPYKFFGPHCGVVAGRVDVLERLRPDKLLPSSDSVPSASSWAPCPTSCWPERPQRSTSSPTSAGQPATAGLACSRPRHWWRRTRIDCARASSGPSMTSRASRSTRARSTARRPC